MLMVASAWHTGFEAGENPSAARQTHRRRPLPILRPCWSKPFARFAIPVEGVSGADTSRIENSWPACL